MPRETRQEVSSGGVVFRRLAEGTRYLLILDGHGNWGFPKGHVENGESAEEAARREIEEETGLARFSCHGALADLEWTFDTGRVLVRKRCHYFLFESPDGATLPRVDEGITECVWLGLGEATAKLTFRNASDLLEAAAPIVARIGSGDDPS